MKNKALLFSLALTVYIVLQPAQAQLLNDLTEKGIDIQNCTTSDITVTVDNPCTKDCTKTLHGGDSAEFKTSIGSKAVIHVTDAKGTKYEHDTGILTNPIITRWFFWDGKELSGRKGKCKD